MPNRAVDFLPILGRIGRMGRVQPTLLTSKQQKCRFCGRSIEVSARECDFVRCDQLKRVVHNALRISLVTFTFAAFTRMYVEADEHAERVSSTPSQKASFITFFILARWNYDPIEPKSFDALCGAEAGERTRCLSDSPHEGEFARFRKRVDSI